MQNPHDEYLATQVLTATPDRLRLMLIEAALRKCELARQTWDVEAGEPWGEALSRAQDLVTELLASLNFVDQPELARKIAAIYNYIFRELVAAHLEHDATRLGNARKVLEIERDTWRQVAQKLAQSGETAPARAVHAPHAVPAPATSLGQAATSSLSLEA
jgi:flagellar protein FliS